MAKLALGSWLHFELSAIMPGMEPDHPSNEKSPIRNTHSLAEAKLYLLVQRCGTCGRGPMRSVSCDVSGEREGEPVASVTARCDACNATALHRFRLPHKADAHSEKDQPGLLDHAQQGMERVTPSPVEAQTINPTDHPSELLDVGQWITLAVMLIESAEREADAVTARQLRIEAGLCLDEAIKFYTDDENDLPPPQALFTDESRDRFRRQPEQFSRRRLRSMRVKLPRPSGTT